MPRHDAVEPFVAGMNLDLLFGEPAKLLPIRDQLWIIRCYLFHAGGGAFLRVRIRSRIYVMLPS